MADKMTPKQQYDETKRLKRLREEQKYAGNKMKTELIEEIFMKALGRVAGSEPLTKREAFAAHILPGLLGSVLYQSDSDVECKAKTAVRYTDALIKALEIDDH